MNILSHSYDITPGRMPRNLFDDKSTLVQVIWLGAIRQQAFTWANVDPDLRRHMASLGHSELNIPIQ